MDPIAALDQQLLAQYEAKTPKSAEWYRRAAAVMPGGDTRTGTFYLPYPLFASRGEGCRLWDADGNAYLDVLNNFTSLLHGHAHPAVNAALAAQIQRGTVHGTANELQVRLAEMLCQRVPSVERLRFCNSGTEATLFALRAAKAFTGRSKIMKMGGGYHGSHDQVAVAMTPPYQVTGGLGLSPGAIGEVIVGSFNDLDATADLIRRHRNELACVIVEPIISAAGAIIGDRSFHEGLRRITEETGVLLAFDEIVTFRLGFGGLQEHYGIKPDLTTFGKIIGGGLPIGAFGGRADVMSTYDPSRPNPIVHSGTYNGHAAAMAAGLATLELFDRPAVEALNRTGEEFRRRLNTTLDEAGLEAHVAGFGSLSQLHFLPGPLRFPADAARNDRRLFRLMHVSLLNRGIFTASRQMYVLSTAMGPADLDFFQREFAAALEPIAAAAGAAAGAR